MCDRTDVPAATATSSGQRSLVNCGGRRSSLGRTGSAPCQGSLSTPKCPRGAPGVLCVCPRVPHTPDVPQCTRGVPLGHPGPVPWHPWGELGGSVPERSPLVLANDVVRCFSHQPRHRAKMKIGQNSGRMGSNRVRVFGTPGNRPSTTRFSTPQGLGGPKMWVSRPLKILKFWHFFW